MCVYIYIYIYILYYTWKHIYTYTHSKPSSPWARARATKGPSSREFRDVVFEDVVFDSNSYVTPY